MDIGATGGLARATIAYLAGFISGFLGGLFPGLHSNTIISVLSSLGLDATTLSVMIVSLYPAHLVSSFLPSIFFGIPESGTAAAVLPGQRMVMAGGGIVALKTILLSCVASALICAAVFQISLAAYPLAYAVLSGFVGPILLAVSALLLARCKNPLLAALVFALSGVLGKLSFSLEMPDPFLPLFSGMFAIAAILCYRPGSVPRQEDGGADVGAVKYAALGVLLGFGSDLLPGIGSPSQVASFATMFLPLGTLQYLATISSISISQAMFSFSTASSIGKSRVGATAWLSETADISKDLWLILPMFVIGIALAVALAYAIRKKAAKIASLDFAKMNAVLAAYLLAIVFIIDGLPGIAILALSSALGYITLMLGVERTNLMGAIIVPTLLLLFRIFI